MRSIIGIAIWLGILAGIVPGGTARANVRIACDSARLDFGKVDTTTFKELTLQIRDTSNADVQIDAITPIGSGSLDFKVISPSFPLAVSAGGTVVLPVVIRFSPHAIGLRTASLLIQTSDGNVVIPLTGTGTTEVSSLAFSMSEINFGVLSPGLTLDTIIELYSAGPDSATILGGSVINGSGASTFVADFADTTIQTPFKLAPGDSVAIRISVTGFLPTGPVEAQFSIVGVVSSPAMRLLGDVEWASFTLYPLNSIDFGPMYAGEVRDTILHIVNIGAAALDINAIDPPSGDFAIINEPALPILIRAGASFDLTIRANPALNSSHQGSLSVISMNAEVGNVAGMNLILTVPGSALSVPSRQNVNAFCAIPGTIDVTVPVTDTIERSFVVSRVSATDPSIVMTADVPFPDTIGAGMTRTLTLHFDLATTSTNKIVLQFFGGDQVVATDTVYVTDVPSSATIALVPLPNTDSSHRSYDVRTQTTLAPFVLDTLVVHIESSSSNAAEIDSASIVLASGLSNARVLSITGDASGYVVTIFSSIPLSATTGSSILSFSLMRYVSSVDSSNIMLWADAPERSGCLTWIGDTQAVPVLAVCGANQMQSLMSGGSILFDVRIRENPSSGPLAHLTITANDEANATYTLSNVTGEPVVQMSWQLGIGQNEVAIPVGSLPSGTYYLRIAAQVAGASRTEVRTLAFIKRD